MGGGSMRIGIPIAGSLTFDGDPLSAEGFDQAIRRVLDGARSSIGVYCGNRPHALDDVYGRHQYAHQVIRRHIN